MKYFTTAILLFIVSGVIHAQSIERIYLWPDAVPGETEAKDEPVVTPDNSNNVKRLTDVTNPAFEVYLADPSNANGAGILVCPGGGNQILAIDLEGSEVAKWLNEKGYNAYVLEYRVPQKQTGALMDAQRAMRIIRKNASKWNQDQGKLGVMGFSAGGGLGANLSTRYEEKVYGRIDGMDDISSRPDFVLLIYPGSLDKGENKTLSPELKITEKTPPMFIFATADDRITNNSFVMAIALRDAKIPVEFHMMTTGGHGYGLRKGNPAAEVWPSLAEVWLKGQIRD
ncbi:MAG: alpha/beta hydrolase [Bacteroidetes bacterium]|nr:alpha/beta hydrolase [Bacteroidota bacterium]MDA1121844.1 alpha/beta hydrolase [Bacteroidota bacterium]